MNFNELLNNIHTNRCEDFITLLENDSIDLLITSPAYNVKLGDNKFNKNKYDTYEDNKTHEEYIKELKNIFSLMYSKMVSGGRICINIGDGRNGMIPTHSDIIQFMTKELNYLIKATILWMKNTTGNRTAWGSWLSPSNPSFPTMFEYILIFCKDSYRKAGPKENITVTKEEFIRNSNAIWTIAPEKNAKKIGHPAPFPIEIPYRLIQQLSYRDDIVFDPFVGSGTTCLAAKMLDRRWLGCDMSENYVRIANERLNNYRKE